MLLFLFSCILNITISPLLSLILLLLLLLVVVALSSLARILGERSTIHSPTALFFPFFFKVEVRSCTLIPLFRPGSVRSGSESWDNCDCEFPDKLHVSLCPDKFPHYAWTAAESAHSNFIGSRVYVSSGVTCHLYFWQNDRGLLPVTAVTWGGTDTA